MIKAIAGFVTALLAGLGIGGGGLLVIYLAFFEKLPQLSAQGINLVFFLFSSAASMLVHLKKRRIPLVLFLLAALFGSVGAYLGSMLTFSLSQEIVRKLFGVLLCVSGLLSLIKRP